MLEIDYSADLYCEWIRLGEIWRVIGFNAPGSFQLDRPQTSELWPMLTSNIDSLLACLLG